MNLKAIRYESTSLERVTADKSHRVIVALQIKEAPYIQILTFSSSGIYEKRLCLNTVLGLGARLVSLVNGLYAA